MEHFIHNKYSKWYFEIIEKAKGRDLEGYSEKHHIIPKSFGGSDAKTNLVRLTAREHLICHRLLVKMTKGEYKHKMIYAIRRMVLTPDRYKVSSRVFEKIRTDYSLMLTGRKRSEETKKKMSASMKGKPSAFKGQTHSEEIRNYLASFKGEKNSRYGVKVSEETRMKMVEAHSGVNNSNYKKKWFNDGQKNYFIHESDAKINYVQGRLISWKTFR